MTFGPGFYPQKETRERCGTRASFAPGWRMGVPWS